jgi:hypothetical protein
MAVSSSLSPCYRVNDELPWLEGIDPSRHYWIAVNGDNKHVVTIPGLIVISSIEELREAMRQFRSLQPGEQMSLERAASITNIYCIASNCYAVEGYINEAAVLHLFDCEALDSLLMTAHPDWQCSDKDIDLGRKVLQRSFQQATAIKG